MASRDSAERGPNTHAMSPSSHVARKKKEKEKEKEKKERERERERKRKWSQGTWAIEGMWFLSEREIDSASIPRVTPKDRTRRDGGECNFAEGN